MKSFHFICLAPISFLICSCAHLSITNKPASPLIRHLGSVTVALEYHNSKTDIFQPFCTGVWVSDKKILTAGHCAIMMARHIAEQNDEDPDTVTDYDGTPIHFTMYNEAGQIEEEPYTVHLSKVVKVDEDHDLALLEAQGDAVPPHDVAQLASRSPAIGETIHIVGQVKGLYWTYVNGTVAAYRDTLGAHTDKKGPWMQVSAPVYYGNSGGGAFDSDGKLVGIASFLVPIPNGSCFVHAETIRKFLEPAKKESASPIRLFSLPGE